MPGSQGLRKLLLAFQALELCGSLLLVLISPILLNSWGQHFKDTLKAAAQGKEREQAAITV